MVQTRGHFGLGIDSPQQFLNMPSVGGMIIILVPGLDIFINRGHQALEAHMGVTSKHFMFLLRDILTNQAMMIFHGGFAYTSPSPDRSHFRASTSSA
jgi:hypothetical protein